jgi:DNA invertase Pin-like site-specific DNA recombinase
MSGRKGSKASRHSQIDRVVRAHGLIVFLLMNRSYTFSWFEDVLMTLVSKVDLVKLQKTLGTDVAIAKKFKVTRQTIHYYRVKYGIDSLIARKPDRNAKIIAMYKAGKTGIAIAPKFGLTASATYRIIKKAQAKRKSK